jgi:myosin tail region-interacting protein MTI1
MSASDAKESIGKVGSLKERMAALQGKGAFGAPEPVGPPPRPAGEKSKWKPPPKIASPPTDDEGESAEPLRSPPAQYINPVRRMSEDQPQSPPPPGETAVAPDSTDGDASGTPDPEEEERQRRAAIAARMARLGGARLGMGPPVFAPKPAFKKPDFPRDVPPVNSEASDVDPVKSTDPAPSVAVGDGKISSSSIFSDRLYVFTSHRRR